MTAAKIASAPDAVGWPEAWGRFLAERRSAREQANQQRRRRVVTPTSAVALEVGDRPAIGFCNNDYLGLAHDPRVIAAASAAVERYGAGSGAASLVSGYGREHQRLESALAEFLGREAVLLCSSGYLANLAVAGALADRDSVIVQDRLAHASLIDAAQLSGARLLRYPHVDVAAAARQLDRAKDHRALLVTDGIFSMDGDAAPVTELAGLALEHGALLVVDDAHGIGVTGAGGRGVTAGLGSPQVPILVGTLGKAFGAAGAFIAGPVELIEQIENEGRAYLFDTAMPPAVAAAARAALGIIREEPQRRARLSARIEQFRAGAAETGIDLLPSDSPIQPVVAGDAPTALTWSGRLWEAGFLVPAIRPPTVPVGQSRLRVTLSSEHEATHVDQLLEALNACRPR
ncbi:MAG: 8-amino-7-oxononanoate synthase [Xanthomonadales bacterium]|nr:8-amino-7-oxononanoate synthase [Xanthomonadales bacterium]